MIMERTENAFNLKSCCKRKEMKIHGDDIITDIKTMKVYRNNWHEDPGIVLTEDFEILEEIILEIKALFYKVWRIKSIRVSI